MSVVQSNQKGYVALLGVLISGAVSIAIATALLLTGVDAQRGSLITLRSAQARSLTTACAEEALQQIWSNSSFTTGGTNLTIGSNSCTYTVTNTGGSNRTITTTATIGSVDIVVRKLQISVTIGVSSISVTSWQEVI
jgi:hypothetical protein